MGITSATLELSQSPSGCALAPAVLAAVASGQLGQARLAMGPPPSDTVGCTWRDAPRRCRPTQLRHCAGQRWCNDVALSVAQHHR